MRYRAPIIQRGLTREEAKEIRARYLKINLNAKVTIDPDPEDSSLTILIAHLPTLPFRQVMEPGYVGYRGWRA